ncbi:MAG: hypothetical protein IJJ56_04495 [Prevotella sp.]|nr:hypothetical protein [Prevotella sp.]
MEKTIKTGELLNAFKVLSTAKYDKLSDDDKIKLWKISCAMMPFATQYEDLEKDAAKRFKPTTEGFDERMEKAQGVERMLRFPNLDASTLPMGAAEYNQFIVREVNPYNKLVADALKEFSDAEVKLKFDGITKEAFGKLMASNGWAIGDVTKLGMLIVE